MKQVPPLPGEQALCQLFGSVFRQGAPVQVFELKLEGEMGAAS